MSERKLVEFDLTREDIPALPGHDWTKETPYCASMAQEDLRVTSRRHPGRFQQVLALACQMMEKANPGTLAALVNEEYIDGERVACTVTPIPAKPGDSEARYVQ
jgi:hypothetical protein